MSWPRAFAALGITSWVIALIGFGIHGYPRMDATPQQLMDWATTTDPARFEFGITVEATGILLFVFFVAWLCQLIWRSGGQPWLLAVALVATGIWAGGGVVTNGIWSAVLDAGKQGLGPASLTAIRDIAQEVFNADNVLLAPALIALGLAAAQTSALPRWLSWVVFAIGVLMLVPPLSLPLQLLFVLWVGLVSVLLIVRPADPSAYPQSSAYSNAGGKR